MVSSEVHPEHCQTSKMEFFLINNQRNDVTIDVAKKLYHRCFTEF